MAKLVAQNHPALHTISEEITSEEFSNGTVAKILKDMRKAIKEYSVDGFSAVAIAAPQIGVAKRMFLIEDQSGSEEERFPTIIAINPHIVKTSKRTHVVGEGCLSVPKLYGVVKRHTNVTLEALDENGKSFTRGAGGLLAQIIQHECDHLDGTLFIDRAEDAWPVEKEQAKRKDDKSHE
ncbi:MAG: peptide deformylase [Candidatus Pacebacteria bacterium]|nr:peptide deformylase [Candidatus Paceibacterota bacterium]MBP9842594.1 peptide deformylase [Candidatus Paceibacterota bacterium]